MVPEGCKKKCNHGECREKRCVCEKGWFGSRCNRRNKGTHILAPSQNNATKLTEVETGPPTEVTFNERPLG
ncbi:UNVERIFIED_CONTAM: hypothetical protein NCL1_25565 [Trichonephila clavipes]